MKEAAKQLIIDRNAVKKLLFNTFDEFADFSSVGRMAVLFNFLDQGLLYLAIELLGFRDPGIGMGLVKTWTVDQKVSAIKKVMAHYQGLKVFEPTEVHSTLVLLDDINEISKERNKWLHGFYSDPDPKSGKWVLRHPKWSESLTVDWKQILPLIARILSTSKRLGDCADLVEDRLQMLYDGIRQLENQATEPGQQKD